MALGGLWHGARLNFLLWGIYQGALLCAHRLCEPALRRIQPERPLWRSLWTAMCWAVFFHLVCYGWLLFRADSAHHIATLTAALAGPWRLSGAEVGVLARIAWFSWPLVAMELAQWQSGNLLAALTWPWPLRTAVYVALFYLVVIFGSIDGVPFIYFQF
jgi:hypothetical protein